MKDPRLAEMMNGDAVRRQAHDPWRVKVIVEA